ncbi:Uncharacterised protein [Salmonella enterica subsp. enterica serovar Bovismorbificans]|uniref:Uncharacterized protein n=1 Tax=Salmonella enterica subsp. enterica serovar Bovismorbificans TaxID=58097 RepID=A0A655BLE0_SALET|nr:Uncharacterised protein [Salmonella enterica subsp. enterica serovar Bovismorbificans]CNT63378.1 Uncharacterised protein [Salmonella enterica subsp. enterica serovar Bovismorbificans]CPR47994.1 Uncharacterised protein [Salmonella enterica subsp. enterica serovar Bovismorbificans]
MASFRVRPSAVSDAAKSDEVNTRVSAHVTSASLPLIINLSQIMRCFCFSRRSINVGRPPEDGIMASICNEKIDAEQKV